MGTNDDGISEGTCELCGGAANDGDDEEEPVETSDDPFEIRGLKAEKRKIKVLAKDSLPPWWILHAIPLNGPEINHGSYKTRSFSEEQQKKCGIDAEGNIIDQEKFD